MTEAYHQRDYNIKPGLRERLEARMGKTKLTHNEIEILMTRVFKGEFGENKKFTPVKTDQLHKYIKEIHVNEYSLVHLDNVIRFMKMIFTDEINTDIVTTLIDRVYRPGMVHNLQRISNVNIGHFYSQFSEQVELCDGIIINPTYIADVNKILTDVGVNEETGEITDTDVDDRINEHLKGLRLDFSDLQIGKVDGTYVIGSTTPSLIKYISTEMNNVQFGLVPKYKFIWV